MLSRLVYLAIGLALISTNVRTLRDVVKYYTRPGSTERYDGLLRIKGNSTFSIVLLLYGMSALAYALLPKDAGTYRIGLPTTLWQALNVFTLAAFVEELLFRILPWAIVLIVIKYAKGSEFGRVNIAIAVIMSVIFGVLHITNYANPDVWAYIGTIKQTIGGLLFWYMLDRDGILSSTAPHMLFNTLYWVVVAFVPALR
jgi:membrane protease YdiL (CAAX protease family)